MVHRTNGSNSRPNRSEQLEEEYAFGSPNSRGQRHISTHLAILRSTTGTVLRHDAVATPRLVVIRPNVSTFARGDPANLPNLVCACLVRV